VAPCVERMEAEGVTPYYQHAGITIYHGDSREIVPSLGFDGLVLTDPPYGIALVTAYKARSRGRRLPSMVDCCDYPPVIGDGEWFDPRWLLDVGTARIIWGGNYFASALPDVSGWLVWDKERPDNLDQATCELAWTDCIKGVRRFRWLWNGAIRRGDEKLQHPTQKPVALMRWCMSQRWTEKYTDILDPYMGSGSTLRAAKDLGKSAVGVEMSERYCEVAARRLEQESLHLPPDQPEMTQAPLL